jgi:hypothetical protein
LRCVACFRRCQGEGAGVPGSDQAQET